MHKTAAPLSPFGHSYYSSKPVRAADSRVGSLASPVVMPIIYQSDGTGRDKYILKNSGGMSDEFGMTK